VCGECGCVEGVEGLDVWKGSLIPRPKYGCGRGLEMRLVEGWVCGGVGVEGNHC